MPQQTDNYGSRYMASQWKAAKQWVGSFLRFDRHEPAQQPQPRETEQPAASCPGSTPAQECPNSELGQLSPNAPARQAETSQSQQAPAK